MNTPLWPLSWTFKQRRVAERKEFPLIGGTIDKNLETQTCVLRPKVVQWARHWSGFPHCFVNHNS